MIEVKLYESLLLELVQHFEGATRPPWARPQPGLISVENWLSRYPRSADRPRYGPIACAQAIAEFQSRPPTLGFQVRKPWVVFRLWGPPPYPQKEGDIPPLAKEVVDQWAEATLAWLFRCTPHSTVSHVALHQDEEAPHLHVALVARNAQERWGWNAIKPGFMHPHPQGSAPKGRAALYEMHERYWQEVCERCGIRRPGRQDPVPRSGPEVDAAGDMGHRLAQQLSAVRISELRIALATLDRLQAELATDIRPGNPVWQSWHQEMKQAVQRGQQALDPPLPPGRPQGQVLPPGLTRKHQRPPEDPWRRN